MKKNIYVYFVFAVLIVLTYILSHVFVVKNNILGIFLNLGLMVLFIGGMILTNEFIF